MKVKEHSEYSRLLAAMVRAAHRAQGWNGTIFRSAPPRWAAGPEMLTGTGSMKSGARFNAPGTFPAVYGSTSPELAMIESLAYQRRAGVPVERAMPLVFKAIRIEVERLLDLTDAAVLSDLGLKLEHFRGDAWWVSRARGEESLSQAVGRAAYSRGVQAMMAASSHALDRGVNVIVFPSHLVHPSRMRVLRRSSGHGM